MFRSRFSLILLLAASVVINSCGDDDGGNLITDLFFPVEDDIKLGAQLRDEIAANPGEYPVLSETQYPDAYGHLRRIRDEILNSGEVTHRDDFAWEVRIIQDDSTLNAFAAPGGFIYVYTGLIKFLDNESEFAGVMGHEIAHADRRHSVNQLSKAFGVQLLLDVTLGQGAVSDVLGGLVNLSFSRSDESDADDHSVIYLCPTTYKADGAAGFFEKIEGQSSVPAFLSTHPSPGSRVENIRAKETELGCTGTELDGQYQDFKDSLP